MFVRLSVISRKFSTQVVVQRM